MIGMKKVLFLRVSDELKEKIRNASYEHRCSMNELCKRAIKEYLESEHESDEAL